MFKSCAVVTLILTLTLIATSTAVKVKYDQGQNVPSQGQNIKGQDQSIQSHGLGLACKETLDIAIVGAGPGGAYSAYKLRDSGKTVGLFEYSSRVGGRQYNYVLPSSPDVVLQLGANSVMRGGQPKVEQVISELGLKYRPHDKTGKAREAYYFLRNKRLSTHELLEGDIPYKLNEQEKKNQNQLLWYYFNELQGITDFEKYSSKLRFTREELMNITIQDGRYLYELSFDEALALVASPDGHELVKDYFNFKSFMEHDVNAVVQFHFALGNDSKGTDSVLEKGMNAISEGLVETFLAYNETNTLRKNVQLTSIRKKKNALYMLNFQPTVTKSSKTTILNHKQNQQVCARQVVLALPVFALRQVDWAPLQEVNVKEAFNSVRVIHASKIYMSFDSPWWLDYYNDTHEAISDRDSSFNHMADYKTSTTSGDHIIVASFADGNKVNYLKHLNTGPLVNGSEPGVHGVSVKLADALLSDLALALNVDKSKIPSPKSAMSQFWTDYPFGGAWIAERAGHSFDHYKPLMRRPSKHDDVFVVGSDYAWGMQTGWTEGAFETVESVLREYFTY